MFTLVRADVLFMGQLWLVEISLRLPYVYLCLKNSLLHLYK